MSRGPAGRQRDRSGAPANAASVAELEEACALVGVAAEELAAALGAAPDAPDGPSAGDGESGSERESDSDWCAEAEADAAGGAGAAAAEWCRARRDRLLGALYGRLFTWLVTTVNARLRAAQGARTLALSILDVYGLEALAHNALERLLVNYAAERLQACVTRATLRREQDEYVREGLAWAPLRAPDHDLVADLLDAVSGERGAGERRGAHGPRHDSSAGCCRAPTACWPCCATAARAGWATWRCCSACSAASTRGCWCCRRTTSSECPKRRGGRGGSVRVTLGIPPQGGALRRRRGVQRARHGGQEPRRRVPPAGGGAGARGRPAAGRALPAPLALATLAARAAPLARARR